jgi:ubiquinone biosynthesis protein
MMFRKAPSALLLKTSARIVQMTTTQVPLAGVKAARAFLQEAGNLERNEWPLVFLGELLAALFESAGPVFVKVGQVLATREDLLPPILCTRLQQLYNQQRPVPFSAVEHTLRRAYPSWPFASIDSAPLGVGTVGQVHRAILNTGQPVVVKILKPGVQAAVEQDLNLFQNILQLLPDSLRQQLRMVERAITDLRAHFEQELDLEREALNLIAFKERCRKNPAIHIPYCYQEHCRPGILVMECVEGTPLGALDSTPGSDEAKAIARTILLELLTQVFDHGHFHGDPHAGNLIRMADGRIAFIDLGLTGTMTPTMRQNLTEAVKAIISHNPDRAMDALLQFAVVPDDFDRSQFRSRVAEVYREHRASPHAGTSGLESLVTALFSQAYKSGLYLPPSTMVFIKAMVTIEGVARKLDPHVDVKSVASWVVLKSSARSLWRKWTRGS